MKEKTKKSNHQIFIRTAFCVLAVISAVFFVCCALLPTRDPHLSGGEKITEPDGAETNPTVPEETLSEAQRLLEAMTQWEKIGQLFVVQPEMLEHTQPGATEGETGCKAVTQQLENALARYPVGGIAMFAQNLQSPQQITKFNQDLQQLSKIPLFIAIDEEGGAVARIANHNGFSVPRYKSAAAVGATGDTSNAEEMGGTIGMYLREYGFNMNFAPVADVYTNPQNTVIGNRAFSSDAQTASNMASAMAQGLRNQNITPVFKHFPGHGDTAQDSHYELAVTYKTLDEMMECEWLPFKDATNQDFVMLGHVAAPNITGDMTPATMSYQLVTECLRQKCGFSGLIITDSFVMDTILKNYASGEAAVMAFQAGCDIVLMPEDLDACFLAVESALENGNLTEKWLDDTVLRILEFKLCAMTEIER
ncbi:MAG: glycoside hydrolase family 3 protein [Ruminococcaceae bacterium]|nr:glycoside hydrolase family 3 protein [Oscillospiraceae bacterium]